MKAKEGVKGTVRKSTEKYSWDVDWDDGKIRVSFKSQQLKQPKVDAPAPATIPVTQAAAPPATTPINEADTNIPIAQGKFRIYFSAVGCSLLTSSALMRLFSSRSRHGG
jgi:hypothetical protein